jgi:hypothetical protein
MTKLIGLIVTIAAFLLALWIVILRKGLPDPKPKGIVGARFWVLVTLFAAMLGGGPVQAGAKKAKADSAASLSAETRSKLAALPGFAEIKKDWLAVEKLEGNEWNKMKQSTAEAKQNCAKNLMAAVRTKLISQAGADAFCLVAAERVYHKLRKTAASCYDPTMLGAKIQLLRDDFEARLKALSKASAKLTPQVIEKTRKTIVKQMEMGIRVKTHWDSTPKDGKWEAFRAREQAIMSLFTKAEDYKTVEIKDVIEVRPGVYEAIALVDLIYEK